MIQRETRRAVLTVVVAVVVVSVMSIAGAGLAAAQPSDRGGDAGGDAAPSDGGGMPSLPDAASGVAKDVLGTVGEFLSGGIDALGEALRGVTPGGGGGGE